MSLGRLVMVPLTNPASVPGLIRVAVQLVDREGGFIVPVTVVSPGAAQDVRRDAQALVVAAEDAAAAADRRVEGLVATHESVAAGVLEAAEERDASLVLMGWKGRSTNRNVFGELIDTVVGRSRTPMAVVRLGSRQADRVLLPVSDEHLVASGAGGVTLAADLAGRVGPAAGRTVRLLRTGESDSELPEVASALSDRVHHDPRRYDVAIGAAADANDLVVVPVAPTVSGLRTATTHVAWAAPEATLLVAIDVGPQPGDVEQATERADQPAPTDETVEAEAGDVHTVVVLARHAEVATTSREQLGSALRSLGTVGEVEAWEDEDGRRCLRTRVHVSAPGSNHALAIVMTALHEAVGFTGAELRYEIEEAAD